LRIKMKEPGNRRGMREPPKGGTDQRDSGRSTGIRFWP